MTTQLKTIYAKEFFGYFGNLSSYFILGIYIILTLGCAFMFGNFFEIDNQNATSFFRYQADILAVLIPGITMHLWTDEYRSGTIEILLTQPIEYKTIVIGKYLASVSFGLIMISMLIPQLILIMFNLPANGKAILSAFMSTIFIVFAFSAIGNLISSLSKRPVVTYLGSLCVIWLISSLSPEKIALPASLKDLSFNAQNQALINGKISLFSCLYFICLSIFALYATTNVVKNLKNK